MKIGFNAVIVLVALFSSVSFAGKHTGSQSVLSLSSIVVNDPSYGTYFTVRGNWAQTDQTCPSAQTDLWIISSSDIDEVKSMYSLALSAYASKTTIELYQDGCANGRPTAKTMYLPNR